MPSISTFSTITAISSKFELTEYQLQLIEWKDSFRDLKFFGLQTYLQVSLKFISPFRMPNILSQSNFYYFLVFYTVLFFQILAAFAAAELLPGSMVHFWHIK